MTTPSLFGIKNLNKNLSTKSCWGKNQFNNLFPVSLALYMDSKGLNAVYLKLDTGLSILHDEISIKDLFNTNSGLENLYFEFESKYSPFSQFVSDPLESIDLVVKDNVTKEYLRPIEVKLTTLPDNSTCNKSEEDYGSEIVVRDKTTRYIALSIAESCQDDFDEIHKIFDPICKHIRHWENSHEIKIYLPQILESLDTFLSKFEQK